MADQRNTNPTSSNAPKAAGSAGQNSPSQEEISRRAYELFQKRGGKHGYHVQDWNEAERQLREERKGGAKKSAAKKSAAKKSAAKKTAEKKSAAKKSAAKKSGGAG